MSGSRRWVHWSLYVYIEEVAVNSRRSYDAMTRSTKRVRKTLHGEVVRKNIDWESQLEKNVSRDTNESTTYFTRSTLSC